MRLDALLADSQAIGSIESANRTDPGMSSWWPPYFLTSWEELERRLAAQDFDVAIVQPSFPVHRGSHLSLTQRLSRLREPSKHGRLIWFVCQPGLAREVRNALSGIPAAIVVNKGIDDCPETILRALARCWIRRQVAPMVEVDSINGDRSPESLESVLVLLAGWPPRHGVAETAKSLHITPRTLSRRLRDCGYPPPRRLARWSRLLEAMAFRRMGLQSRTRMAGLLHLAGPDSLARLTRDLAHRGVDRTLRSEEEESVLSQFLGQLRA